jgi:signal transduction histidine kinase
VVNQRFRSRRRQVFLVSALTVALLGSTNGAIALSWSWQQWLLWSVIVDFTVGLVAASLPLWGSVAAGGVAFIAQAGGPFASSEFEVSRPQRAFSFAGAPTVEAVAAFAALAVVVAWLVGRSVRERRDHAEAQRRSAAAEAVTTERLRIARELHDLVAHSIGVIAVQAGVGRRVIDNRPEAARDALEAIETTSRETLAGLRRTVASLRRAETDPDSAPPGSAPGLADVESIAASAAVGGVRVDVRPVGDPRPLPAEVDLAAYRIIQEAVTNAVRHSGASDCRVTVEYRDDAVIIDVSDTGRGGPAGAGGFGITGMRERATLLGGDLTAGPRPDGGFRVRARLPLPAVRRGTAGEA